MATDNRSRGGNRRGGLNNNPDGRNQYSGVTGTARSNPFATAAAVGSAVAAGVFLWSRRNQISDQIGNLSDQISEWREGTGSTGDYAAEEDTTTGEGFMAASSSRAGGDGRSQAEISEEALTLKETGKAA